jgi:hypothetical protein
MSLFIEWVWAVVEHWQVFVTGGIIAAVLAILQARGQNVPWSVYRWLLILALFVALFLAWRDQYLKAKPRVSIKMTVGGTIPHPANPNQTLFYTEMLVSNIGGPNTGLLRWKVSIQLDGKWIDSVPTLIQAPAPMMFGDSNGTLRQVPSEKLFIPELTMKALAPGDTVSGFLTASFNYPVATIDGRLPVPVRVSCLDVFENEWSADVTLTKRAPFDLNKRTPGVR